MRAVLQRVLSAEVRIASEKDMDLSGMPVSGKIGKGLLVLAGFVPEDTDGDLEWIAKKILSMRMRNNCS